VEQVPPTPVVPFDWSQLSGGDLAGIAIVALLVALFVAAGVRLFRKKREVAPPAAPVSDEEIERELEGRPPEPAVDRERETTEMGTRAARKRTPPAGLPEGLEEPPPPTLPELPADREAEEARKKEAYRLRKEEERAEKERRKREKEELEAAERAEAERLAREAEDARAREAEEKRRRVEAEAGKTLAAGLEKTRGGFMSRLQTLFSGPKVVDDAVLAQLEEVLFTADIGVKTATSLLDQARAGVRNKELSDPERLKEVLRAEIARIVSLDGRLNGGEPPALSIGSERPHVIMVVGVNGAGKTTTIGKLASKVKQGGHSVVLGAGDTFRAAAGEQLEVWAERVGAPVVRGKEGGDPASVCFDTVKRAVEEKIDVAICDTAGRLHTKAPLMEELKKVKRVMAKAMPSAPHEVLLVLDATTGQNAIAQARQFHEALGVTGIALAKLDGTAKGGVIIGICDELKLPVRYVGVGEKVADLRPFAPKEFVEALFQ
jgi:fused signal recognition particle receptor